MINFKVHLSTLLNFFHLSSIQATNALLQILLFPLIIRLVGLEAFGQVMVANAFAAVCGILINYGTNQSGIKDVALLKNQTTALSVELSSIFSMRLILFALCLIVLLFLWLWKINNFPYYLFALTIIFSEVLNPLFFYIGIEKLSAYNITNLIAKIFTFILIIFFIRHKSDAPLINFLIGIPSCILYMFLLIHGFRKYQLNISLAPWERLKKQLATNFYLACSNISVHLQQSSFLFIISSTGNAILLGAYALCDKLIWACRLLIISFSSAIYPKAIQSYQQNPEEWLKRKSKTNFWLATFFMIVGISFLTIPHFIVQFFSGTRDQQSIYFLRIMSIVPVLISLNAMNMLELLLRNRYRTIFYLSLIILIISSGLGLLFLYRPHHLFAALYPLIIETVCLLLYFISLNNLSRNHPSQYNPTS